MEMLMSFIGGAIGLGALAVLVRAFARRARRDAVDDVHRESQEEAAVALHDHNETLLEVEVEAKRIDDADAAELAAMIDEVY